MFLVSIAFEHESIYAFFVDWREALAVNEGSEVKVLVI